jgi:hypothetical protein
MSMGSTGTSRGVTSHTALPMGFSPAGLVIAMALVALAAGSRLVDLPWNASAVAAVAMLAGFLFQPRVLALGVPLAAMLLTDLVLGGYQWQQMLVVYACLLTPALLGRSIIARWTQAMTTPRAAGIVVGCALLGSAIFFVFTNLAVFVFDTIYPKSAQGLVECFVAAIPFARATFVGDLAWALVLFGGHALVTRRALKSVLAARFNRASLS